MGESKLKIRRTCHLCGRTMKLTAKELKKHAASCSLSPPIKLPDGSVVRIADAVVQLPTEEQFREMKARTR